MACNKLTISVFCTFLVISSVPASKLNVPRILLPIFNDFSTKFILEAVEGGCYKWTTTRSDIIKLTPIDQNKDSQCSSKVLVKTITKEENRNLAVVLAEDVNTGQMLKCDVIVDVIHSLSVTTTTRELFMEEVPEIFQINAYDDQGNEFSTLEGVEFEWNIVSTGKNTVLRYLPFKDSSYETPPHIEELEEQNKKGHMVLFEGVKTGSAKVVIRLPHTEYKHVESIEAVLSVIANLLITPAEVYIMPGDIVTFKVFHMNSGRMDEIYLPDHYYFLDSADKTIATCIKDSTEVTALKEGRTQILLRSLNVDETDPALKLPTATINVVEPAYIVLSILPHKNWAILIGDQHEILAEVYSTNDHRMYLGSGVEIHTQVGEAFHVEERTRNGSWISGWGVKASKALVTASLENIVHPILGKFALPNPLKTQTEMYIYPRITISPSEVILPWDPQVKPKYEIDLVAKGGDGRFLWTSTDHTIGMVTQTGHVRTVSHGSFQISAAMQRNHHNRQFAKFTILPPCRLEIAEFVMEAEVGSPIFLHIALYAEKPQTDDNATPTYVPFTKCQDLPFQVRQSDTKFVHNKTLIIPPVGISCGNIAMVGVSVGTSKVTVTYYQDGLMLEDSVTISAYKPLELIQPESRVVLAVGSSINLVYTGGPKPLIGRPGDHQRIVVSQNDALVQAEDITQRYELPGEDTTVVWALCRKVGETSVKLMISNTPSLPNCKPRASTLTTKVICGKPRRIHIVPDIKIRDTQSCPMDLSADRVMVPKDQDINLNVVVQDNMGRIFLNISTYILNWEAKPAIVKFRSIDGSIPKNLTFGPVTIANKSQQIIKSPPEKGLIDITVTMSGYKSAMLKASQISAEWPEFLVGEEVATDVPPIKSTIGLFLVDDTVVNPNFTILFNHPNRKKTVSVLHGSGYVELSLSDEDIACVDYTQNTREIEITPKQAGEMTIQLVDLCLVSEPVFIFVKVVTVGTITVEMSDRVEINHCIHCVVRIFDEAEQPMDLKEIGDLDLKSRLTKNIANLGLMPENEAEPWAVGEVHYILTGIELGTAQLTFSFECNGEEATSPPMEIQVFAPLKMYPRNGTLLVGSVLQLTIKGGPQPHGNIEFVALSNKTAQVTDTGIVKGMALGTTRITARAMGLHPRTGEKVIFSEDSVDVQVIKLNGFKITSPLTKLKVGGTVPCWASGIPESLSPLVLGSYDDDSIIFNWYLEQDDVVAINTPYNSLGILYSNLVAIRVLATQPGTTRLHLNVTVRGSIVGGKAKDTVKFHTSLDFEVFQNLILTSPSGLSGKSLLLAQFSSIQLETNLDDTCDMTYRLPDGDMAEAEAKKVGVSSSAVMHSDLNVSDCGLLSSNATVGYSILLVTSKDANGVKQTLTYVVEVKPVHYMMLSILANWRVHLDSSLRFFPLGTEFELVTDFYDDMGTKFNAGPREVKVRSNRLDLLTIKKFSNNGSFYISTRKPGHTVIKTWTDDVDKTADYIHINAQETMKPILDYLTYGDILCLWSPLVTKNYQVGHWATSDCRLVSIDQNTDVAQVIGNEEATVAVSHPLQPSAPLYLKLLPVSNISLIPAEDLVLTNGPDGATFNVAVVLMNSAGTTEKMNNLIQGWQCDKNFAKQTFNAPFECRLEFTGDACDIDIDGIFNVESNFKPEVGQYNCKIVVIGSNSSDIATLESNISLTVETDEGGVTSEPLEIPFIPNVYVTPEVHIGDGNNIGELDVIGLPKVLNQIKVQPADCSILYVDNGIKVEPTKIRYRVQLVDYHWKLAGLEDAMSIIIESPLTNQLVKVMVKVTGSLDEEKCGLGKSPVFNFFQSYRHALIIILSMLVIFCVTCYVYSRYMQPMVTVNVHPNRSLLASSPLMQNPATSCRQQSPSNNQPFIPRLSPSSHICNNKFNCSCLPTNRQPAYGDVSSFSVNSPELRRNRRFL